MLEWNNHTVSVLVKGFLTSCKHYCTKPIRKSIGTIVKRFIPSFFFSIFFLFFFFSTGLIQLYIAGLPLRSCSTIGLPSVGGPPNFHFRCCHSRDSNPDRVNANNKCQRLKGIGHPDLYCSKPPTKPIRKGIGTIVKRSSHLIKSSHCNK